MGYLPASGEITYDAWKEAIMAENPRSLVQATLTAKRAGLVEFVNRRDANGTLVPMVKRTGAADGK